MNSIRKYAQRLGAIAAAVIVTACGGSDDAPTNIPPQVTAAADTFTLDVGQTGALLANDRIGSSAATIGTGGNATFTLTTTTLPTGVTVTSAVVNVAATAVPGVVSLSYQLCEAGSSTNCATATAQITIPAPAIVAAADSFSLTAGSSGDVLANDTLGGTPATAARVTVTAVTTLPAGITLSAAGLMAVDGTATAGTYPLTYRICQTIAPTNCANAVATVVVPVLGMLTGRAIDSATAAGIAGVHVSVGALSATTDSSGGFAIANVPVASRATVNFASDNYAEASRIASVTASTTTDVQVRMVSVGATVDVGISAGGTATMSGSPAQVTLPADAVQRADGSVPTGTMQVRITPINPATDSAVMPGDFTTLVGETPAPIDSFGALNVRLSDSAGAPLNLRTGQTATIRIPLASRDTNPPTSIPLFYFDTASGRWVQEGTATLAGSGSSRYYQGTVAHFTTWNADQVSNTVRITGCLVDAAGIRVANALVATDGIDYSGTSSATTDATGNFVIAIRANSSATMVALSNGLLSNTLRVGPYGVDTDISGNGCLALGQTGAGVTMKLTWGALPSDLDSHLYTPNGSHVYYGNKGSLLSVPFANLDVDDTSSYGPEVITITKLMVGTYKYAVHNYSGYGAGPLAASGARVELSIPGRAVELYAAPAAGETSSTTAWQLFEMDVDASCNVTVRRVNTYGALPSALPTSTPVYCTR